jgi:hypothetical protein
VPIWSIHGIIHIQEGKRIWESGLRLEVKQAVDIATKYLTELYADRIDNLLLEEVELVEDNVWNATLGFTVPREISADPLLPLGFAQRARPRHYKVVRVDAYNGSVLAED